jgi:ferritin-like metal-binding protein YciE
MAMNTPRDLFVFELGLIRDAESAGGTLFDLLIAGRIKDSDLERLLHEQAAKSKEQLRNIGWCFQALGSSPVGARSLSVEGIRSGFQEFLRTRPSPQVQELFALDAARRFLHLTIAGYTSLVDWAALLNESQCAQELMANLAQKQEGLGKLERLGHQMSQRLLASAGSR